MAIIALPAAAKIRRIEWTIDQPAQVNRSEWTKRRQVVVQPGASLWSATAELVVRIGELNMLEVEAFLVDLEGQINSFRLPACEGPQSRVQLPLLVDGAGQTGRTLDLKGGQPGANLRRGHKLALADQMVMLMGPIVFDAAGKATATFKPTLRASPADNAAVEAVRPTVLVSLVDSAVGWSVDPGQIYQAKELVLEEAI